MATQWGNWGANLGASIGESYIQGQEAAEKQRMNWVTPDEIDSAYKFMSEYIPQGASPMKLGESASVGEASKEMSQPGVQQIETPTGTPPAKQPEGRTPAGGPVKSPGDDVRGVSKSTLDASMSAVEGLKGEAERSKAERMGILNAGQMRSASEIRQYRDEIIGTYEKEQRMIMSDLARLKAMNKPVPRAVLSAMSEKFKSLESDKAKAIQGVMKENMDITENIITKYLATSTADLKTKSDTVKMLRESLGDYQRGQTAAAGMDLRTQIANEQIDLGKKRLGLAWDKYNFDKVKPTSTQQKEISDIYENKTTLADIGGMIASGKVKTGNLLKVKEYLAKTGDTIETVKDWMPVSQELALSPEETDFLFKLQNLNVGIRRANWGTQQTGNELRQLSVGLLNSIDTPEMFMNKLKAAGQIMDRSEQGIYWTIKNRGNFASGKTVEAPEPRAGGKIGLTKKDTGFSTKGMTPIKSKSGQTVYKDPASGKYFNANGVELRPKGGK